MGQKIAKWLIIAGLLIAAAAILSACGAAATPCPECPETECPDCPECPEVECPEPEPCPETVQAPFEEMWAGSGHADVESEAFRHWDEDGEVEADCAKCHSGTGLGDFLGVDGSAVGVVDSPQPIDTVISCNTCHNEATAALSTVEFPSGAVITGLGAEAVCMNCHQGRASGNTIKASFEELGVTDWDAVTEGLRFTNIHYYAAAVTRYGKLVGGGFEYDGQSYDALFEHVEDYNSCQDCHDSHTLELKLDDCAVCHEGAASVEDLRDIRTLASMVDYDGDGDLEEGVYYEIAGLQEKLYEAIRAYSAEVVGTPLAYSDSAYPYFLQDLNGDGEVNDDEANRDNGFATWTPRLAAAAYNLHTSIKDPGAYAHGGKYIIQLLYDSTASLNEALSTPVDLSTANRIDHGHFAGSEEAFRHWDEDGFVEYDCATCHSSEGLPMALANGGNVINVPLSNGLRCDTCHNDAEWPARYVVESVTFPSGAAVSFAESTDSNLCLNCHQGRESTVSVNNKIEGLEPDVIAEGLSFTNVHYFAAGATLFGNEVMGAYQYDGKEYLGQFAHVPGFDTCASCHDAHELELETLACSGCHGVEDPTAIRGASSAEDYDGDGDVTEGLAGEVETEVEKLYAALQAYGMSLEAPIAYGSNHPYWFIDTNANGVVDGEEGTRTNAYVFSPRMLQAAYNYQYVLKDPGAYTHNGKYVLQVLYDSIEDLSTVVDVDMTGMVRP